MEEVLEDLHHENRPYTTMWVGIIDWLKFWR